MSDEIGANTANTDDGEGVAKPEHRNDTKEPKDKAKEEKDKDKSRSVSFNRDVHVKRYGKPRESRGASLEPQKPATRKEPFTHLSEQELIEEANKVLAQAGSITCTSDHPADKFYSLPHRKKNRIDRSERRNSDENTDPKTKSNLGRSTSDVTRKGKERTSLSTLFRRAKEQKNKAPVEPIVVTQKPTVTVKRSHSDVSDLKSAKNSQPKPYRKRTSSETEEFLKSLRNNKAQLSPIIESSPREDYFKKTPPLDIYQKQQAQKLEEESKKPLSESNKTVTKVDTLNKVNPIEKPPRFKASDNQGSKPPAPIPPPGPPAPPRSKRGKSSDKEKTPPLFNTGTKPLIVDEVDSVKTKDSTGKKVRDSIRKIKDNVYAETMRHSSQQPPDKPPLTRGQTVDHMVRILREDQMTTNPKTHIISPQNGSNINQPFSYTKPSVSPDPNLFIRTSSPERVMTPVNKMTDKGVVYAQVVRENSGTSLSNKQTIHKTYTPPKDKYTLSDEDEGYDEKHRKSNRKMYDDIYKETENENFSSLEGPNFIDSPIKPKFREYRLTPFNDIDEPTYANGFSNKDEHFKDFIDPKSTLHRGEADGMDTKRKTTEDLDFNELSHRRQLLESRINRKYIHSKVEEPISKYLTVNDPIYEANKRMAATEKYVNETARYMRHTLERDGFTESSIVEDKFYLDENNKRYNSETRTFEKHSKDELDRREFINGLDLDPRRNIKKVFPPEPEYEPPSLELVGGRKPISSPDEYKEKKYKVRNLTSSHDLLVSGGKYKSKDEGFGKRKGLYASNPEIASERADDIYANLPHDPKLYYNSLRKVKNTDRYEHNLKPRRHGSGDSADYYRETHSPRRYEYDSRLVDSGIENDFRKESSGELYRNRSPRYGSDDDIRLTSRFLVSERRHTEDSYPCEYINDDFIPKSYRRIEKSPRTYDDKISTKPPKAKRLSGLEKVKMLFSRDSSKKSKKEKEPTPPKARTRVLKSPEHLGIDDPEYRRYTDPEPSDIDTRKAYDPKEIIHRYKSSQEDLDPHRPPDSRQPSTLRRTADSPRDDRYYKSSDRESDTERRFKTNNVSTRYERSEARRYQEHSGGRRLPGEVDSDQNSRFSAADDRRTRSRTAGPLDSPALAQRYRDRRRLATPSPEPSPPRQPKSSWFKSLDRLARKKTTKEDKVEKESVPSDDSTRKPYSKSPKSPLSPAKNLRFFGDTDQESDSHRSVTKKSPYKHTTLRKTISNSSTGIDEIDHTELTNKSYSLNNLHRVERTESPRNRYYKRNLQNISEIQSNSETESHIDKSTLKPPKNPYDRSRSQSSQKTLKGSRTDVRRSARNEDRRSPSELRSSRQEISRDSKVRRRTPATSGGSSTEGDSSQHSQRSVVYLHATTVGDIPDPRVRRRDDASSVTSSALVTSSVPLVKSSRRSFTMFAPWTPRRRGEPTDLHYEQSPRRSKPSFRKASSTRTLVEDRPQALVKNKSVSQTTLNRKPAVSRLSGSTSTLTRRNERSRDERRGADSRESRGRDGSSRRELDSRRDIDSRRELDSKRELDSRRDVDSRKHLDSRRVMDSRRDVDSRGRVTDSRSRNLDSTLSRNRDPRKTSSELIEREREKSTRAVSSPQDKKGGWFKLSNKNKKPEIISRVR